MDLSTHDEITFKNVKFANINNNTIKVANFENCEHCQYNGRIGYVCECRHCVFASDMAISRIAGCIMCDILCSKNIGQIFNSKKCHIEFWRTSKFEIDFCKLCEFHIMIDSECTILSKNIIDVKKCDISVYDYKKVAEITMGDIAHYGKKN